MKYLCLLCFLSPDLCSLWLCIESLVSTLHHFRCRQHVCPLLRPSAWAGSHLLPLAGLTLVSFHGLAQLPFSRRETGGVHTSINWKPVSVFFYVFGINRFLWWVSLYKLDTICTSWKKKKERHISLLPPWKSDSPGLFSGVLTEDKEETVKTKTVRAWKTATETIFL